MDWKRSRRRVRNPPCLRIKRRSTCGSFPSSVSEIPLLQVRRPTLYVNRRQSAQMLYSTPSGKLTPPGNTTMIGQLEIEPLA